MRYLPRRSPSTRPGRTSAWLAVAPSTACAPRAGTQPLAEDAQGYLITWEPKVLRHFTSHLKPVG